MTADLAAVARRAGVSPATASRVLSGRGPASAASRQQVLAAAAELGYRPHPVARRLARGTGTRVVFGFRDRRTDVLSDQWVCRVVAAVAEVADRHGLGVSLRRLPLDCGPDLAEIAADRSVAALVLAGHDRSVRPAMRGRVATIGAAVDGIPGADVDSAAGLTALLTHLHAQGRRRIALVGGQRWLGAARAPRDAYASFVTAAGLPSRTVTGDFTAARGRAAARRILDRWPDTDAVVAVNDATALGVLAGLAQAGAAVPHDIAVTGFDDLPTADAVRPALSTATHPVERIAAAACTAALGLAPGAGLFPSRPVLRESA
ncbi:LacI family DNA-binding transcriptional regulator [Paractinoplanes rishiriensis]|uniref:LacI family transcriptional regulator n=1 Tax=Paractinoplanes rishiriensis TaxID=1050105 RepID=A0A919K4J9_9ACTN|nr:LacI family DNA-binding transcriptional regulator [Actinoplanes rishiriensis]GIF00681.1 LacI family transcriptional regulator [Actinoplanes rishiriensis]